MKSVTGITDVKDRNDIKEHMGINDIKGLDETLRDPTTLEILQLYLTSLVSMLPRTRKPFNVTRTAQKNHSPSRLQLLLEHMFGSHILEYMNTMVESAFQNIQDTRRVSRDEICNALWKLFEKHEHPDIIIDVPIDRLNIMDSGACGFYKNFQHVISVATHNYKYAPSSKSMQMLEREIAHPLYGSEEAASAFFLRALNPTDGQSYVVSLRVFTKHATNATNNTTTYMLRRMISMASLSSTDDDGQTFMTLAQLVENFKSWMKSQTTEPYLKALAAALLLPKIKSVAKSDDRYIILHFQYVSQDGRDVIAKEGCVIKLQTLPKHGTDMLCIIPIRIDMTKDVIHVAEALCQLIQIRNNIVLAPIVPAYTDSDNVSDTGGTVTDTTPESPKLKFVHFPDFSSLRLSWLFPAIVVLKDILGELSYITDIADISDLSDTVSHEDVISTLFALKVTVLGKAPDATFGEARVNIMLATLLRYQSHPHFAHKLASTLRFIALLTSRKGHEYSVDQKTGTGLKEPRRAPAATKNTSSILDTLESRKSRKDNIADDASKLPRRDITFKSSSSLVSSGKLDKTIGMGNNNLSAHTRSGVKGSRLDSSLENTYRIPPTKMSSIIATKTPTPTILDTNKLAAEVPMSKTMATKTTAPTTGDIHAIDVPGVPGTGFGKTVGTRRMAPRPRHQPATSILDLIEPDAPKPSKMDSTTTLSTPGTDTVRRAPFVSSIIATKTTTPTILDTNKLAAEVPMSKTMATKTTAPTTGDIHAIDVPGVPGTGFGKTVGTRRMAPRPRHQPATSILDLIEPDAPKPSKMDSTTTLSTPGTDTVRRAPFVYLETSSQCHELLRQRFGHAVVRFMNRLVRMKLLGKEDVYDLSKMITIDKRERTSQETLPDSASLDGIPNNLLDVARKNIEKTLNIMSKYRPLKYSLAKLQTEDAEWLESNGDIYNFLNPEGCGMYRTFDEVIYALTTLVHLHKNVRSTLTFKIYVFNQLQFGVEFFRDVFNIDMLVIPHDISIITMHGNDLNEILVATVKAMQQKILLVNANDSVTEAVAFLERKKLLFDHDELYKEFETYLKTNKTSRTKIGTYFKYLKAELKNTIFNPLKRTYGIKLENLELCFLKVAFTINRTDPKYSIEEATRKTTHIDDATSRLMNSASIGRLSRHSNAIRLKRTDSSSSIGAYVFDPAGIKQKTLLTFLRYLQLYARHVENINIVIESNEICPRFQGFLPLCMAYMLHWTVLEHLIKRDTRERRVQQHNLCGKGVEIEGHFNRFAGITGHSKDMDTVIDNMAKTRHLSCQYDVIALILCMFIDHAEAR